MKSVIDRNNYSVTLQNLIELAESFWSRGIKRYSAEFEIDEYGRKKIIFQYFDSDNSERVSNVENSLLIEIKKIVEEISIADLQNQKGVSCFVTIDFENKLYKESRTVNLENTFSVTKELEDCRKSLDSQIGGMIF